MEKDKIIEGIFGYGRGNKPCVYYPEYGRQLSWQTLKQELVRQNKLRPGARLLLKRAAGKSWEIEAINGRSCEEYQYRKRFEDLIVINPDEKFDLGSEEDRSLRAIDLIAPIGKGSRCLLISPPRGGKTILLEKLAAFFARQNTYCVILLIDERPEEVTHFMKQTGLPVYHSSLDSSSDSHTRLAALISSNLRQELESGNDVVVLLDSITRLGRAHNRNDRQSNGRILSGGIGAKALEMPRKLFGMARNIENGGSCTIIATVLKDTGSRMDEYIFQEFKGTGNIEIVLDRDLASQRIYPALNLKESGTRREELFRDDLEMDRINLLIQRLYKADNKSALIKLLDAVDKTEDNKQLLSKLRV